MLERELSQIDGLLVRRQVHMAPHTTFRIGGTADLWIEPVTTAALEKALKVLRGRAPEFKIIGHGSNLLIDDAGMPAVICLSRLSRIEMNGSHITAEAGAGLWHLIKFCLDHGIGGLEPLFGIPASVGGACFMNAGANGRQFLELVDSVQITTDQGSAWISAKELTSDYRTGGIPEGAVVSACRFPVNVQEKRRKGLCPKARSELLSEIRRVMTKRTNTQPITLPSAGCVFKNPPGDFAGRLLDLSGLKGRSIGQAVISQKHANFIVNMGGAGFQQVMELMELAASEVERQFGIRLKREVTIWQRKN